MLETAAVDYLFVYGTLRCDTDTDMYRLLAAHATYIGTARYRGRMYRIDYYPGVVPSDEPVDTVYGEVYRLADTDLILAALDEYEGCSPHRTGTPLYVRRAECVNLEGQPLLAWIYLYNLPVTGCERIASGDFLA